ncbi:hypothetical protein FHR55_002419 [Xanthomonas arboricola]
MKRVHDETPCGLVQAATTKSVSAWRTAAAARDGQTWSVHAKTGAMEVIER